MSFVVYNMDKQEKSDLEKYIKFFCVKAVQAVCQSRSGEKTKLPCDPNVNGGNYWVSYAKIMFKYLS